MVNAAHISPWADEQFDFDATKEGDSNENERFGL